MYIFVGLLHSSILQSYDSFMWRKMSLKSNPNEPGTSWLNCLLLQVAGMNSVAMMISQISIEVTKKSACYTCNQL